MTSSKTEDGTSVANDSVRTMIVPKKQWCNGCACKWGCGSGGDGWSVMVMDDDGWIGNRYVYVRCTISLMYVLRRK
jgi:hypothetical protein